MHYLFILFFIVEYKSIDQIEMFLLISKLDNNDDSVKEFSEMHAHVWINDDYYYFVFKLTLNYFPIFPWKKNMFVAIKRSIINL